MNEDKWIASWKQIDSKEKETLNKNRGEFKKLAMKKSDDIFNKIRSNMITELIVSVIISIGFPFLFLNSGPYFWIMTSLMIFALVVTLKLYLGCMSDLKNIQLTNIQDSLGRKTQVLARYIKNLKFICYFFGTLGFAAGFNLALFEEGKTLNSAKIGLTALLSIPILALFYWLINKYIYSLYGKHLASVKIIYNDLINGKE